MGQREQCRYVFIGAEGRETYTFNSSVKELIQIEREEEERAETERERESRLPTDGRNNCNRVKCKNAAR